MIIYYKRTTIC